MFAALHGVQGEGYMMLPVRGYIDKIDVVTLAKALVGFRGAAVKGCVGKAVAAENLIGAFGPLRLDVTEGDNLRSGNVGEALHRTWPPHAEAYESDPDGIDWRQGQRNYIFLPGRTLRHIHLYYP